MTDHDLLIKISATLELLNERLFGDENGEIFTARDRLSKLEEFRNMIRGGFALLTFVVGLLGTAFVYHVFFGRG